MQKDIFKEWEGLLIFKACTHYFLSDFYFSSNDSPSKTIKNVFYFIEKGLFVLEISNFCNFFHFFLYYPDSKGQMEVE